MTSIPVYRTAPEFNRVSEESGWGFAITTDADGWRLFDRAGKCLHSWPFEVPWMAYRADGRVCLQFDLQ